MQILFFFFVFLGEISHTSNRQVVERRRVLISSIGLLAVALFNASKDGVVLAAEFADSNFLLSLLFITFRNAQLLWNFRCSNFYWFN